jgi:hypothetical protein
MFEMRAETEDERAKFSKDGELTKAKFNQI